MPATRLTLSTEQWQKIVPVLLAAIEVPASDRHQYVSRACAGEQNLAAAVHRLLEEQRQHFSLLDEAGSGTGNEIFADRVFTAGETLAGRFRVIEFLGAGGMGEVYEVYDSQLQEAVAIKTLRREFLSDPMMALRFREEVQRSRRIVHRNVCRVYDLFNHSRGQLIPFFTMQLLKGATLASHIEARGSLPEDESVRLLTQIAEALQASHDEGLVHRDLKPANIFLVSDSGGVRAVVTDFGLAAPAMSGLEVSGPGSSENAMAGTPAYMAPEQVEGSSVTNRTDVYALGLVAAELRCGSPVYGYRSPLLCGLRKLSTEDPLGPEQVRVLTPKWATAIRRALARDPRSRFATPGDFVRAISKPTGPWRRWFVAAGGTVVAGAVIAHRLSRPAASGRAPVIAVLPFENSTRDPNLDYFSDGVAEELIQSLNSHPGARVVARNSAFHYRASPKPVSEIAKSLGATAIVTGSVRRVSDRVRVSVQLADGSSGRTVWTEIYDRELRQILAIQADILQQLALHLSLAPPPQTSLIPVPGVEAYDHYLRARRHWNARTKEGMEAAIAEFTMAVRAEPSYAAAWAGIADSQAIRIDYGLVPTLDALPAAKHALTKALAIDSNLAEAYAASGLINCIAQWDQPAAERSFLRALTLKPSLITAHHWYGGFLMRAGRFEEALARADTARQLDPLSLPAIVFNGWVHHYRRDYRRASAIAGEAIKLGPAFPHGYQLKALALAASGDKDGALEASGQAVRGISDEAVATRFRALALSVLPGLRNEALAAAEKLEHFSEHRQAAYMAIIYAGLRETARMYHWLDRAIEIRDSATLFVNIDRAMDPYRNDPQFRSALRQIGYAPAG